MKILIIGSQGMLGQMAVRYFGRRSDIIVSVLNRRFDTLNHEAFIRCVNEENADVVLNCVGLIKQRCPTAKELFDVNARLPALLAMKLRSECIFVHPSTDCIFKGDRTDLYAIDEPSDAEDDYGISKSMGELSILFRPKTLLMRTSIIGPDMRKNGLGLMAWLFKQSPSLPIKGYTNHFWNGITTLEWCKQVEAHIEEACKYREAKIVQPGLAKPISKYELLRHVDKIYDLGLDIIPHENNLYINRSLRPSIKVVPIEHQLVELKNFY